MTMNRHNNIIANSQRNSFRMDPHRIVAIPLVDIADAANSRSRDASRIGLAQCTTNTGKIMGIIRILLVSLSLGTVLTSASSRCEASMPHYVIALKTLDPTIELTLESSNSEILKAFKSLIPNIRRTTSLDLSGKDLKKLPYSILNKMHSLEGLDISNNPDLEINPKRFAALQKRLVLLNFANNELTVDTFNAIINCRRLKQLCLRSVALREFFDIGNLASPRNALDSTPTTLYNKEVNGPISGKSLINASSGTLIDSYNKESNNLISVKSSISTLINFYDREISPANPPVPNESKNSLGKLQPSKNREIMIDEDRSILGNLIYTLTELDVSSSDLTVENLKEIRKCTQLQKLSISVNMFDDLPEDFTFGSRLENNLVSLSMRACALKNGIFSNLDKLISLKGLKLSWNDLSNGIDLSNNLTGNLTSLSLTRCQLDSSVFLTISKIESLNTLNIACNDLSGDFDFGRNLSRSLRELNLSNCQLNSGIFTKLSRFLSLKQLNLSCNDLSKTPLNSNPSTGQFTKLSISLRNLYLGRNLPLTLYLLNLSNSGLNDRILSEVTTFESLIGLSISHNNLHHLPDDFDFGNLTKTLMRFDISECKFSEILIERIKKFKDLQILSNMDS